MGAALFFRLIKIAKENQPNLQCHATRAKGWMSGGESKYPGLNGACVEPRRPTQYTVSSASKQALDAVECLWES